jgi:hypothetical protein
LATNTPLLVPPISVHALRSLFEFSVDMTRFDVSREGLVDFWIQYYSKEPRKGPKSIPEPFQKGFESNKTWSSLIERIKKKNPVFGFFWNKVDKLYVPKWKRGKTDHLKKILDDYNDTVKTSKYVQHSSKTTYVQPSKITSPVVRKASLKLAHR